MVDLTLFYTFVSLHIDKYAQHSLNDLCCAVRIAPERSPMFAAFVRREHLALPNQSGKVSIKLTRSQGALRVPATKAAIPFFINSNSDAFIQADPCQLCEQNSSMELTARLLKRGCGELLCACRTLATQPRFLNNITKPLQSYLKPS